MAVLMTSLFVCGTLLLAVGAWLAWPPAGFLVAGWIMVMVPWLWVRGAR